MKRIFSLLLLCVFVGGCDLQPKIAAIPDSIGDFISERYPTLLAEPDSEIYKTAVADYGVYASPALYGNGDISRDDYVLYAPQDDYMLPAQDTTVPEADVGMPDEPDADMKVKDDEYTPDDDIDDLIIPDYVNGKPVEQKTEDKTKLLAKPELKTDLELVRAPVREITVAKGDTLYSLSRRYSVPVNDLAVMNKISAPFVLSVGQKLKVPDILSVPKIDADVMRVPEKKVEKVVPAQTKVVSNAKQTTQIASNAKSGAEVKKPDVNKKTETAQKVNAKKIETVSGVKVNNEKQAVNKTESKQVANKKTVKTESKKADSKKVANKKAESKKAKTMAARSSSKFSWPVRGKILSGYGSKTNGLFNDGINIKANKGATVSAAENGLVAYAGNEVKGMGNLVIIQHSDGWMTVYAHMDSFVVRRGHAVTVGQKIGTVGTSGKVDQPQLHFEIRKGTKAYNPVNYLKK